MPYKTHRITPFFLAVVCMLTFGTGKAYAQMFDIDSAIQNTATSLSSGIEQGSRIAVLSMYAGSVTMSNYIINEMIDELVNMRRFTVVDRAQLELLMAEMEFQMSGYVDDTTAQSLGRLLGVEFIITGAFEPFVANYRLRARVLEVRTAAIHGAFSANVHSDTTVAFLLGVAGREPAHQPPAVAVTPPQQQRPQREPPPPREPQPEREPRPPREPREPRPPPPPREPRPPAGPPRTNWLSAYGAIPSFGLRYERMVSDAIAIGGVISMSFSLNQPRDFFCAEAAIRVFPTSGRRFYLGAGFGLASGWSSEVFVDYSGNWGSFISLSLTPEIGWRLGGRHNRSGFFINPFVAAPILIGSEVSGIGFTAGVGFGVAWR